ncbi:MAG: hypothetical protein AB1659_09145, partial [Thermodesulfobacteriota bacterium]
MDIKASRQSSILQKIMNGSMTIDSQDEFDTLFKIFPENPILSRAYGDFLAGQKSFFAAADIYGTAARLFIEEAKPLSAIVAKLLEWRIVKPSHNEVITFHSAIGKIRSDKKPSLSFWTQMSYPELLSLLLKVNLAVFQAGAVVQKLSAEENAMYFIVSGALKETRFKGAKKEKPPAGESRDLTENDFFGTIYPFDKKIKSDCEIETINRSELIKITKIQLSAVCKKYPNLEGLIKELYEKKEDTDSDGLRQIIRRTYRHNLPTQVKMKIPREDIGQEPLILEGFTDNISLGGACVFMEQKYRQGPLHQLIGRPVKF